MSHLMVYLDEFGHIGQFVSRHDKRYKTSPVFGLAGIAIPVENVRELSMLFFKLKCQLLAPELAATNTPPAQWEKKGSSVYTIKNVGKYPQLRRITIRILNKIKSLGGFVFFTGIEKEPPLTIHKSVALYFSVLKDAIRKLNKYCHTKECTFSLLLDSVDSDKGRKKFRLESVASSGRQMFGNDGCYCLTEPAYQLESHLYQTMQCADWVCAIVGRIMTHESSSREYDDYEVFSKYFGTKLKETAKNSTFKKRPPVAKIISLPE